MFTLFWCLMLYFLPLCTLAFPLPDSAAAMKPSLMLPTVSEYATPFSERDPTKSSERRIPSLVRPNTEYDVYRLRNLEDPIFVSGFQIPAADSRSQHSFQKREQTLDDDGVPPSSIARSPVSTDVITRQILELAERQTLHAL